jgi:uncharacterized protein with PIN domain
MLGSLARWFRFMGFDTFYANQEISDDELLNIAQKENRIIITRDKELVFRCRKRLIKVIHIISDNVDDQILIALRGSNVDIIEENLLSRCSECNTLLENINKSDVGKKVPKRAYAQHDEFLCCPICDRVYWLGTHTEKIIKKIRWIMENL